MATMKCLSIALNSFPNDSRVLKEAKTLSENGFDVFVFALHERDLPLKEKQKYLSLQAIRTFLLAR